MLDILLAIAIENTNPAFALPKSIHPPVKVVKEFIPPDDKPPPKQTHGTFTDN